MNKQSLAKRLALGAVLAAAAGAPVMAEGPVTDPAKVEAGTYAVDPNHTMVVFGVSHMGFTTYYGSFSGASGTLELAPEKADTSRLSVSVATGSVIVPSEKLAGELKSADWLDAAKFPEMTFHSTAVKRTGKDSATVTGELTLHGVTKPVTLTAHFMGAGTNPIDKKYTVGFEANGKIMRSEFGVKTYVPLIGDEVDLRISGAFEKQG
jgi:polyisoprenoid-binding protein YceI